MGVPQKILERRKIKTVFSGETIICSCGKEFKCSISYYEVIIQNLNTSEIRKNFTKIVHDYPRVTCHCRCGKKWGKH